MSNGITRRPGSMVGPLILIALGALFLYANFRPELNPWPLVSRYWPLILIFLGLGNFGITSACAIVQKPHGPPGFRALRLRSSSFLPSSLLPSAAGAVHGGTSARANPLSGEARSRFASTSKCRRAS